MSDFLDVLVQDALATVASGYYDNPKQTSIVTTSLTQAILQSRQTAVIAEVKGASPSAGTIRQNVEPASLAQAMVKGGAVGISVLTEPKHFGGSLANLVAVRQAVSAPILMKDFVVSQLQIAAAEKLGANVVLLIMAVFDRKYPQKNLSDLITDAHNRKLEVLLETHTSEEFSRAIKTEADLIGINNRDLGTLKTDLNVTKQILAEHSTNDKVVISESGISSAADMQFLRKSGASAFLVGSSVMRSADIEAIVRELVEA